MGLGGHTANAGAQLLRGITDGTLQAFTHIHVADVAFEVSRPQSSRTSPRDAGLMSNTVLSHVVIL